MSSNVKMVTVAVYGSLRRGCHNYYLLGNNPSHLGNVTLAGFDMYDLGSFPGIVHGTGSVFFEIYSIPEKNAKRIRDMELDSGYTDESVDTPFGVAVFYLRAAGSFNVNRKVESGDWVKYIKKRLLV